MKLSNVKLIGILVALIAIYGVVKLTGGKKKSKSLRTELVQIDTASVTAIRILSKGDEVKLDRQDKQWQLTLSNGKIIPASQGAVNSALGALLTIKPSRMATKNESKWKDYQVDSTGTRVQIMEGKDKTLDLVIGRFGMQGQRAYHSFVRLFDDKEVYAVNNFMSFSVPAETASYRDKILARIPKDSLLSVDFNYPADTSMQLTKNGDKWNVNGQLADSASVAKYVSSLNYISGSKFTDDYETLTVPDISATFKLSGDKQVVIEGYKRDEEWVFHSSANTYGYFTDENLLSKVFKGANDF